MGDANSQPSQLQTKKKITKMKKTSDKEFKENQC